MNLPTPLLDSLQRVQGFDREAFIRVHESGHQVTTVRFNPAKITQSPQAIFDGAVQVPWSSYGYYLPERPTFTFDPLLHAGVYYVQEASGMFLEQALKQTVDLAQPLRVLDLCAAPGGKSTLLQSLLSPDSVLVSNEVIKSRAAILEENLTKWGAANTIITNNDPKDFARLEGFFDVVLIDAPCSGSGLFRRDPEAIAEWSEQHVALCCQRQKRILADVYPALKEGGILIYSTCSYSKEEDEDVLDWIADEWPVTFLPLSTEPSWHIVATASEKHQLPGYRFFPDKLKGEGFFISCFRKESATAARSRKDPKQTLVQKLNKHEAAIVQPWLKPHHQLQLWKLGDRILAFPAAQENALLWLIGNLYVKQAGISVGKIAGNDLVPDHGLALSTVISDQTVAIPLKKEEALQYLRKDEVTINAPHKGWTLVQYEQANLGWIKVLPNRINNYYPQGWRIRSMS